MINEIRLAGGTRTPIGGYLGALAEVPAPTLGSVAIKECVCRAGLPADQVDEVILGNVVGAGLGQNIARQAAIAAGLPPAVGATTVNKVCGSGMKAVMLAAQAIQCGDAQRVSPTARKTCRQRRTSCPRPGRAIAWDTANCWTR